VLLPLHPEEGGTVVEARLVARVVEGVEGTRGSAESAVVMAVTALAV